MTHSEGCGSRRDDRDVPKGKRIGVWYAIPQAQDTLEHVVVQLPFARVGVNGHVSAFVGIGQLIFDAAEVVRLGAIGDGSKFFFKARHLIVPTTRGVNNLHLNAK